jgi:hypothetical protein
VAEQLVAGADVEQRMHQSAIAHIELGRADEALAKIAAPRRKAANQQQVNEQIDIAPGH